METGDRESFKWAVTRALCPVLRDSGRVTKLLREQACRFNWSHLSIATPYCGDIADAFERSNPTVSVLILGNDVGGHVIPLYIPARRRRHVARLFFSGGRFYAVNSMSALTSSQISTDGGKRYVCDYCMLSFRSAGEHDRHTCRGGYGITSIDTQEMRR